MSTVLAFDQRLFLFLNHLPHTKTLDAIALFVSVVGTGGLIWIVLGAWLIFREQKKDHRFWMSLLFGGLGSWAIAERILKPIFARPRPDASMGAFVVGLNCCGYSFPSGHATIAFAMAVILSKKEPTLHWLWYMIAVLISLSRIYLGKHYPLDVIAGGIFGAFIGQASLWFLNKLDKTLFKSLQ